MEGRIVRMILPIPPSSNRYWRTSKEGFTFVSTEAKDYKRRVAFIAGLDTLIYSEVSVTLRIFRERRAGDLDNKLKVLFDSLQGVVIADDKQIVEIHAFRFDDRKHPRVEVEIKALGLC